MFRSSPASVGFAQLSTAAGGSGTAAPGSDSGSPSGTAPGTATGGTFPTGIICMCPFFFCRATIFSYFSFSLSVSSAMSTTFSSFLMLSTVTAVIMLHL